MDGRCTFHAVDQGEHDTSGDIMDKKQLVTPRLNKGRSPLVNVRGKRGYFDFDATPEADDRTPFPRYRFVTTDGNVYYQQLQSSAQGGRWENAHHAEADLNRYASMNPDHRTNQMSAAWGRGSPQARTIDMGARTGIDIETLRKALAGLDTWRQISHGEPELDLGGIFRKRLQ